MALCPSCGSQQPEQADFCDSCGAQLPQGATSSYAAAPSPQPTQGGQETLTCSECGSPVTPGEAFCDNCGAALDSPTPAGQQGMSSAPGGGPTWDQSSPTTCPSCGAGLEPGSNFCDMCGTQLDQTASSTTTETATEQSYALGPQPPHHSGSAVTQGRFTVESTGTTLPFPAGRTQFTIGREDPVSEVYPEIDLTDHGGDEGGVSRQHARITVQGSQVLIEDLNSTNHTFVNQQRLTPGQPHPLNEGDDIRLGRVKLTFHR